MVQIALLRKNTVTGGSYGIGNELYLSMQHPGGYGDHFIETVIGFQNEEIQDKT